MQKGDTLISGGRSDVLVLQGAEAILEQSSLLEELAARCGQPGAMHWLRYFLASRSFLEKSPYLVLVPGEASKRRPAGSSLQVEDFCAAVVMFEYRFLGLRSHAFSTDDVSGFRTVVAPAEQRAAAAGIAAQAMLDRGAQFVLVSFCNPIVEIGGPPWAECRDLQWASRRRPVEKTLPLASSFESTLAALGKSTRFNLRYYRKRLLKKVTCEFVADARGLLADAELATLNTGSLNPVAPAQFALQYRSACELPGGFVVGLRGPEGQWLSLIGGWRQSGVTVLHWQMNAAGYEKDSLGTVMRSFFLEHEVERGARELVVYGGTTHSMTNSFLREEATDLVVRRRSCKATLLRAAAHAYCAAERLFNGQNFLAHAICRDPLDWQNATRASDWTIPAKSHRHGSAPSFAPYTKEPFPQKH